LLPETSTIFTLPTIHIPVAISLFLLIHMFMNITVQTMLLAASLHTPYCSLRDVSSCPPVYLYHSLLSTLFHTAANNTNYFSYINLQNNIILSDNSYGPFARRVPRDRRPHPYPLPCPNSSVSAFLQANACFLPNYISIYFLPYGVWAAIMFKTQQLLHCSFTVYYILNWCHYSM